MKRVLYTLPALPAAAAAFVLVQVMRAAHRNDLPSFSNQDPSGRFGDPAAPPLRIVALGDSSITAPGVRDLDNTWIRRLARSQAEDHSVELISLAVGGSKARDVVEGQLEEAVRLRPDVAVVSVGANDAIRGVTVERFRREITHIVSRLGGVAGATLLFGVGDLGVIPRLPPTLRPYLRWRGARFNAVCREVAVRSERVVKVWTRGPVSTAFVDVGLFAPDLFHAGDDGHAVFAEGAMPAMEAAMQMVRRRRDAAPGSGGAADGDVP